MIKRSGCQGFSFFLKQLILVFLFPVFLKGNVNDTPFLPGEKLEYELSWGFFPVGAAFIEVVPADRNPEASWMIRFSVRTNSFADAFYKVRTEATTWVDSNFSKSLRYEKFQQEGKTKKKIKVEFDYYLKKVTYLENNLQPRYLMLEKKVYDPLAIAYAFRFHPTEMGIGRVLPACDGKKFLDVKINVGSREKVKVPFGEFWANDVVPEMKNLSGVFKKSPKGMLRVWYSADNRRIPVKISSKVVVGNFTARLIKASGLQREKIN